MILARSARLDQDTDLVGLQVVGYRVFISYLSEMMTVRLLIYIYI